MRRNRPRPTPPPDPVPSPDPEGEEAMNAMDIEDAEREGE